MITKQPTGVAIHNIEILRNLIPKLVKNHFEFDIYCYDKSSLNFIENKDNIKHIGLPIFYETLLSNFPSIHRIFWNFFYLKKISNNYDKILSLSTYGCFGSKKQIITIHDLISLQYPKQHFFQYIYFKFLVPLLLKDCKNIIAISEFTASEVMKHYNIYKNQKINIIKNGIDHIKDHSTILSDKYVDTLINNDKYILSIGAAYHHKNIGRLISALQLIKLKGIKTIIIGKKSGYFNKLIKRANKTNLNNIIFLDYINSSILSSLYKKASLHVYISLYEGFGFPPAEAIYHHTNSLISNKTALFEVYGNLLPMVEPTDVKQIANGINNYSYHNTSNSKDFENLKEKYNWNNASELVLELLQQ